MTNNIFFLFLFTIVYTFRARGVQLQFRRGTKQCIFVRNFQGRKRSFRERKQNNNNAAAGQRGEQNAPVALESARGVRAATIIKGVERRKGIGMNKGTSRVCSL